MLAHLSVFSLNTFGVNIFSAIADDMTDAFYRTIFSQVREEKQRIQMPYRCDRPDIRREMMITVMPDIDDGLTILSTIVNEVYEPGRPGFQQDATSDLLRCSSCNKLCVGGRWMDALEARNQHFIDLNHLGSYPVQHCICPSCIEKMERLAHDNSEQ